MHWKSPMLKFFAGAALIILAVSGCTQAVVKNNPPLPPNREPLAPQSTYLKNNIHCQRGQRGAAKASWANWTQPGRGHFILPVNTLVTIGKWRRGFTIDDLRSGKRVFYEVNRRNLGMDLDDYIKLITDTQPISLENLSDLDRRGIREGRAYRGMSKTGVRIALGYPAPHKTLNLASNTWTYWKNRWTTRIIEFNDSEVVRSIRR